ncbi:dimethylargininase [Aquipuribacter sp. MA13-6]|uniref:dimethylargininase n=1 Tax=unclassified Aquipuribacter TaxID=2635084 RepID=UPI003EEAB2E3
MTAVLPGERLAPEPLPGDRVAVRRTFLMCRPVHFAVEYAINAWMTPGVDVDTDLAVRQWEGLRDAYRDLGHTVHELDPVPGLPDMVFAANGAFVVDGVAVGARFAHPERAGEAPAHATWLQANGFGEVHPTQDVHEGEGDLTVVGDLVLAGTGFRTQRGAHAEIQERTGRPVIGLELVDPRFYHLDTALFPLDDTTVAWFPGAFSPGSRSVLRRLFPDSVEANEDDALVLGLNSVSDGRHVVMPAAATGLADQLSERGFVPVPVELGELLKGGGGPKCCTSELRR